MTGDNGGVTTEKKPEEKVATNGKGHVTKINVGDKEYKVTNSCEVIGIMVHKLENGKEISQVLAHEFMMVDHKKYMVKLLTDAITTVMRAEKRDPLIKSISEAAFNTLKRRMGPRIKDIFRRKR